jgi:glycosyltransferase involved in cell wall biosynthesis
MRILLVSSNSGSRGGGEIYLSRLASGLVDLGHEVHALFSGDGSMDELVQRMNSSVRVHRVRLRNMYQRPLRTLGSVLDGGQIRRLERTFTALAPEVIHLNQQVPEDGLDMLLAARRADRPTATTIHIPTAPSALGAFGGGVRGYLARRVLSMSSALVIAVSASSGTELTHWLPFLEERLRVVLNGVEADSEKVVGDSRTRFRQQWGVAPNEVVLGAVGRLEPQKDPLFLLAVASRLVERGLPIRIVWVGDGGLRRQVEERALGGPLRGRVVVDGWRSDAAQRLHGFDVLAMPSRFEGLPLALLEAMRAGLACCANRINGIPEAITDGETGRLCEVGDLDGWVDVLNQLIESVDERKRLGRAARAASRDRFSIEAMADATARVYEEARSRCGRNTP